ncbi:MAG TPA: carboxypeptidase regulatory-like domain-containing protein, partial [Candidatus Acidoferrales bacterium]|nr:carboxypeptidase regulatory-like domain-containing protein [Candidatus Acidoferrales bacterium]
MRVLLAYASIGASLCALSLAAAAATPPGPYPGSVVGSVVDATTGLPLPNVQVRVVNSKLSAKTDPSGRFTLPPLAPGN